MTETKKRKPTEKKTNGKKKVAEASASPYQEEIILVVTLVISILCILSNFNLCGIFGKGVNYLLFGLFGLAAYIVPFLLFFGVAFAISNRGILSARIKLISSGFLYLILTGVIQLISNGYESEQKLIEIFNFSANQKNGGGIIGGAISNTFCFLFGEFGTYVVFLGLVIILVMLITEKFLFAGLKKKSMENTRRREERRQETVYKEEKSEREPLKAERRPAKIFTFSKEEKDKREPEQNAEPLEKVAPLGITPDLENLAIIRGYEKKEMPQQPELPIYEEELKNKFSKSSCLEIKEDNFPEDVSETMETIREEEPQKKADIQELEEEKIEKIEKIEEIEEKKIEEKIVSEDKPQKATPPTEEEKQAISKEIGQALEEKKKEYVFPSLNLLNFSKNKEKSTSDHELRDTAAKLKATLDSFGVKVEMKNISCGPSVTRYELQPAQGVKVSRITSLTDDIKLSLAAADIRIEAPIPGKSAVGIEVPNKEVSMVYLRSLLESKEFNEHKSNLAFAVGKDIGGKTMVTDIAKMPHLLIAGATGSGKSVCINTLIMSILYKANPEDVKLIMVDPKVVELSVYNGIPHLLIPVVTDPKKASGALNWAVAEMTERYKKFADLGVRDLKGFNAKVAVVKDAKEEPFQKMPQIVIIVDELADLMMVAPGEVEDAICRLAQLARAAGIHLIIATQRPSVNVITGLIKANIPSRIAFSVSSAIDSRTIIDGGGAEKLLGNGDMLFFPSGYPKPVRVQGSYVSDKEVSAVVEFLTSQYAGVEYNQEIDKKITASATADSGQTGNGNERDDYFIEAGKFIIEKDKASIGMLQRVYKIGFNRAARIMDQLYEAGVVGPEEGTKPRKIIMSVEEFETYVDEYV
ncbi:MAG: DNA translocase FtsK [Acetivibrio sp.]